MPIEGTDYMLEERRKIHQEHEKYMEEIQERLDNLNINSKYFSKINSMFGGLTLVLCF